jgi:peptidoglycan/LPS O-acetylase OafA/YrhL
MNTTTRRTEATTTDTNRRSRRHQFAIVGTGLVLITGILHLALVPDHLEEATYLGVLFAADFVAALVAAVGIYRNRRWGWLLGVAIAVIAIVLYVAHVTVGLPAVGAEESETLGLLTKAVELLYLGVAAVWLRGD